MSYKIHMMGQNDPRTLYQFDRLYAWKHGLEFAPATVELCTTNACNQNCKYCYAGRAATVCKMQDDILLHCFEQFADAGVGAVIIQGTGEPLLHDLLAQAIENGAKRNLPIWLTTNGVLFSDDLCRRILPFLFCLKISVLENDAERYAKQHGCGKSQWHRLIENIETIVAMRASLNLPFGFTSTVYLTEHNFRHLYHIVKFCKDIGFDFVYISEPSHNTKSLSNEGYASDHMDRNELNDVCAQIMELVDDDFKITFKLHCSGDILTGAGMHTWEKNYCQGIKFYTIVNCDGEVYPCWRYWGNKPYSYGNLYEKSFSEIWQSEQRKQIEKLVMETPPDGDECLVCGHCRLNDLLNGFKKATKWVHFL